MAEKVKVLSVTWDDVNNVIIMTLKRPMVLQRKKRQILAFVASIFDPLGPKKTAKNATNEAVYPNVVENWLYLG